MDLNDATPEQLRERLEELENEIRDQVGDRLYIRRISHVVRIVTPHHEYDFEQEGLDNLIRALQHQRELLGG